MNKGDDMKKFSVVLFLLGVLIYVAFNQKNIVDYIIRNYIYEIDNNIVYKTNGYSKDYSFNYVSQTTDFSPKSRQDILNIFYSALNLGLNEFSFFCDEEFTDCIKEIKKLTSTDHELSNINNFVHPYNSYNRLLANINSYGRVSVVVEKLYSPEQIQILNTKVDQIINEVVTNKMNTKDKIKAIHDYIINHTKYDKIRANNIINNTKIPNLYQSHMAIGPLIEGYAICGGYSDAMAIFLSRLSIPNFKVASESHVWNAVYIDNTWYNLDLTWDDPVVDTGENLLTHNFFLISTKELEQKDITQHTFNKNVYSEIK